MGKIRCPRCGSNDCKERIITFDKITAILEGFGKQAIKMIFNGKMDYNVAIQDTSQNLIIDNMSNKKPYRCKSCGYTWEIRK